MRTPETIDNQPFWASDVAVVIKKYEELLHFLKLKLGKKFVNNTFGIQEWDSLVGIKRWLVEGSNRMFWDYLCATHGIVEEEMKNWNLKWKFNINDGLWCTKLIFSSGKEVIFARESEMKCPKWVISLDKFFYALEEVGEVPGFTRINNKLYHIEVEYFKSKEYLERKQRIMQSTREEIINAFNITDAN